MILNFKDFSLFPSGVLREWNTGCSAQEYLEDILIPALSSNDYVELNLNGTLGYASNYLKYLFTNFEKFGFTKVSFVKDTDNKFIELCFNNQKKLKVVSNFDLDILQIQNHLREVGS